MKKLIAVLIAVFAFVVQSKSQDLSAEIKWYANGSTSGDLGLNITFTVPAGSPDGYYDFAIQVPGSGYIGSRTVTVSGGVIENATWGLYIPNILNQNTEVTWNLMHDKRDGQGYQQIGTVNLRTSDGNGASSGTTAEWKNVTVNGVPPVKHPEPLNLEIVNSDTVPIIFVVKNPSGIQVFTGGVGPKQTYSGGWDPPDNAPEGVYILIVKAAKRTPTGEWIEVGGQVCARTLSASNAIGIKDIYSKAWSDPDMSGAHSPAPGQGGGGTAGTSGGTATNLSDSPSVLTWKDELGNTLGTTTIPSGGTDSLNPLLDGVPAPSPGTQQTLTLTDGTGKPLGTVTVYNPGDGNTATVDGNVNITIPPTPTTSSANNGITTTTPGTGTTGTPPVTQTTEMTGGTTTAPTKQDFYEAVRQGLIDAGKTTAGATIGNPQIQDITNTDTGQAQDVQSKATQAAADVSTVKSSFRSKLAAINFSALPTSLGTVSSLNFGSFSMGGATRTISLDLSSGPMATGVSNVRAVILFVCAVIFMFVCVKTVKGYL
jgi:hypothetical protein